MRRKKRIDVCGIFFLALMVTLSLGYLNVASAVEGSTPMVVVFVSDWGTPSVIKHTVRNQALRSVYYNSNTLGWTWTSPWKAGPAGVSGRLWSVKPLDGGKTYKAVAWDWVGPATSGAKHLESGNPPVYWGVMLSTICQEGNSCSVENIRERTNLMFSYINQGSP